jgi:hypothetical protein
VRDARDFIYALPAWVDRQRRDPFFAHIVALTPRGTNYDDPMRTPHNRWITIRTVGNGKLAYHIITRPGWSPSRTETRETFLKQEFKTEDALIQAGRVEAWNQGDNRFCIKTENVLRFSLWLHPQMVDFSRAIVIELNGKPHTIRPTPSLLDALHSYERHRDWGLIYHSEVVMDVADNPHD